MHEELAGKSCPVSMAEVFFASQKTNAVYQNIDVKKDPKKNKHFIFTTDEITVHDLIIQLRWC